MKFWTESEISKKKVPARTESHPNPIFRLEDEFYFRWLEKNVIEIGNRHEFV